MAGTGVAGNSDGTGFGTGATLDCPIATAVDPANNLYIADQISGDLRVVNLNNGMLYHCGPVVIKDEQGRWKVTAAGPTTSIREEPYQGEIIKKFSLRGVIGKGGMGERTAAACKEYGCVYLHAIGGAAQVLAECIKSVRNVYLMEKFGAPEAIWELEVERFPAVVTMDANGNSLHREVFASSQAELAKRL